ncbi:hypothetical protein I3843_11G035900 [Carya illinoinensis]|nr:hypothetical protein I3843_11G035900 [Carya illinoinensis]
MSQKVKNKTVPWTPVRKEVYHQRCLWFLLAPAYIISPPIDSLSSSPFVAHYAPKEHSLELKAKIPSGFFPKFFPENSFLIGLSSIFWREAWKYGEQAFRYCNHDIGHVIAAVTMAATGLNWDVKLLDGLGYQELKKVMRLECFPEFKYPSRPVRGKFREIEFKHPDCLLLVFPNGIGQEKLQRGKEGGMKSRKGGNLEFRSVIGFERVEVSNDAFLFITTLAAAYMALTPGNCIQSFLKMCGIKTKKNQNRAFGFHLAFRCFFLMSNRLYFVCVSLSSCSF